MSSLIWRKKIGSSSIKHASKKFAAELHEQAILRLLFFALAVGAPTSAWAEKNSLTKIIQFDIPQQRADL